MLNDASQRKFDAVMPWAIDRLGRSLIVLWTIVHLEAGGVDLYLDSAGSDAKRAHAGFLTKRDHLDSEDLDELASILTSSMPGGIFLSYRRKDLPYAVERKGLALGR
jgi:hypothetical protein